MEKMKLLEISFWYKDHGYRITEDVDSYIANCENYLTKVRPEHYNELMDQLNIIITNFANASKEDLIIFSLNVYALTKVGKIPNDKFNGLQYVYKGVDGVSFTQENLVNS